MNTRYAVYSLCALVNCPGASAGHGLSIFLACVFTGALYKLWTVDRRMQRAAAIDPDNADDNDASRH